VSGAFKQSSVAHGDFLGAVLGTGITRDKVGDVILLVRPLNLLLEAYTAYFCSSLFQLLLGL
ncbi:unnamed protein product, partial [Closterium sp. NIES-54]